MKKVGLIVVLFLMLLGAGSILARDKIVRWLFRPTVSDLPAGVEQVEVKSASQEGSEPSDATEDENRPDVEVIADDLEIAWEIAWLPDGQMLITQRPGSLLLVGDDQKKLPVSGVEHVGEGGLLGLVLHPDFEANKLVYLYLTTRTGNGLTNRVERYRLEGDSLTRREVIIEGIPGAIYHDGGRMEFGPDGKLYITTGDAGNEQSAQNIESLAGKILRLNDDGSVPSDNPFGNEVYSYGHRNPQGLAWDGDGRLWATEHGPSGAQSGHDELNLIGIGGNYGWPSIKGDQTRVGMETPKANSGASDVWAPAGAVYWDESIFFTGLRGEALYEAKIREGDRVELVVHLKGQFGRLRALVIGPDGDFYVTTSNTDGRGDRKSGDDKVIRINPEIFR